MAKSDLNKEISDLEEEIQAMYHHGIAQTEINQAYAKLNELLKQRVELSNQSRRYTRREPQPTETLRCPNCDDVTMHKIGSTWACTNCDYTM